MAGIVALISNWWNVYTRLAIPEKHAEAITQAITQQAFVAFSRPRLTPTIE